MTIASTTAKRYPGVMNRSVRPDGSPRVARDSSARTEVVPTATTRPPSARVRSTASHVAAGTEYRSVWIAWSSTRSVDSGRNVSRPTTSSTAAVATPRRVSSARSRSVRCRPAVGAAADAGRAENTVW